MAAGFDGLAFFGLIGKRLNWLATKQDVLARNIANADTPEYLARRVASFTDTLSQSGQANLGMRATHAKHIAPAVPNRSVRVERDDAYEASPNGNTVVLEQQMMQVGQATLEHQAATQVYRKTMSLFRVALGRRG
ncbi:MAG: flagellar basal body rod protein FlgB [Pseudomonadota bacterium]